MSATAYLRPVWAICRRPSTQRHTLKSRIQNHRVFSLLVGTRCESSTKWALADKKKREREQWHQRYVLEKSRNGAVVQSHSRCNSLRPASVRPAGRINSVVSDIKSAAWGPSRRHSGNPEAAVVCHGRAGPHRLCNSHFLKI